ncbi:MAG: type II toxin-antitoxin system HicA family toxin [Candidatus Methanofastidiosum sp.]|nr:type II toxin-antitoxin system HicA family toxin [Methanofastidiosum sp.]
MPKLNSLPGIKVIKILTKMGFTPIRQAGSHVILVKQDENGKVGCVVPLHDELKIRTLKGILKQAKIEDNSEAINYIISKYKEDCIDLEVNPKYIDKLLGIDREPGIKFKTINELRQIIESD